MGWLTLVNTSLLFLIKDLMHSSPFSLCVSLCISPHICLAQILFPVAIHRAQRPDAWGREGRHTFPIASSPLGSPLLLSTHLCFTALVPTGCPSAHQPLPTQPLPLSQGLPGPVGPPGLSVKVSSCRFPRNILFLFYHSFSQHYRLPVPYSCVTC